MNVSGFTLDNYDYNQLTDDYKAEVSKLPELLALASQRNLKVIIAFGNTYLTCGPNPTPPPDWDSCSPQDPNRRWWKENHYSSFERFLGDSQVWIDWMVGGVQGSGYCSTVLFYDYQNEYNKFLPDYTMPWYLTYMYRWSSVPAGRRGLSVLNIDPNDIWYDDPSDVRNQMNGAFGSSWHLDYIDFHSYFNQTGARNTNIQDSYRHTKGVFPDSTVLLGEFAYNLLSNGNEEGQQQTMTNVFNAVSEVQAPYYLHWTLVDGRYGWASSDRDHARDVLGRFPQDVQRLIANPDMEYLNGSAPQSWQASGSIPVTLVSGWGPGDGCTNEACTNSGYARVQASGYGSGSMWLISDQVAVRGGDRLYVNSYIRSNMANISMKVIQFNQYGTQLQTESGPSFTPSGWSMNNYLYHATALNGQPNGWSAPLQWNTRSISVMVYAQVTGSPAYLDVDTVSAWEVRP